MIGRIKLKVPLLVMDPEKLHAMLLTLEAQYGGGWDADVACLGGFWRVYGFIPYNYCAVRPV